MKQSVLMLTGACALTVVITGCSPQLDQTQLSPEEQVWAEHIKANYSAWQPPESIPRSVRRDDLQNNQEASQPAADSTAGGNAGSAVDQPPAINQPPAAVDTPPAPEQPAAPAEEVKPLDQAPASDAAAADGAAADGAAAETVTHTVVKGDSLGSLAVKYYGKFSAWKKIQKANIKVLRGKNKDVIVPGMKLEIPKN